MGGFLRMLEVRPKNLGGSHADQIFVLRGSLECFAVRFPKGLAPSPQCPMSNQIFKTLTR